MSDYTRKRKQGENIFSYGLLRRTEEIKKHVSAYIEQSNSGINIVDLGCSDGLMMESIYEEFGQNISKYTGLEGTMETEAYTSPSGLVFKKTDLFRNFPYPFESGTQDVVYAAAFYKHNPYPEKFLPELIRITKSGGIIIITDPCRWVVNLGAVLGYFEKKYCPNIWTKKKTNNQLSQAGLNNKISQIKYEKYWVSPSKTLYRTGIEKLFPDVLVSFVGLHQALIIRKK